MTDALETARYPIGRFKRVDAPLDAAARSELIDAIEGAPSIIRSLVEGLTEAQLDLRYRAGGWTIRQVVHHLPDSHMNAYVRMKLALTEETPAINAYDEARWAELPEARSAPVAFPWIFSRRSIRDGRRFSVSCRSRTFRRRSSIRTWER